VSAAASSSIRAALVRTTTTRQGHCGRGEPFSLRWDDQDVDSLGTHASRRDHRCVLVCESAEPDPTALDIQPTRYGQPGIDRIGDPVHITIGRPEHVEQAGQFGFEATQAGPPRAVPRAAPMSPAAETTRVRPAPTAEDTIGCGAADRGASTLGVRSSWSSAHDRGACLAASPEQGDPRPGSDRRGRPRSEGAASPGVAVSAGTTTTCSRSCETPSTRVIMPW
jgi:hypothetical protein